MSECLNAVGFVFDSVKTYIKKDKTCKYTNYYCQNCAYQSESCAGCEKPVPGIISPCNSCNNNSQYKICIFKLKKENFVSSSLGISTSEANAWELFKNAVIYQRNGNFVISVTYHCNKSHSFYANMIKAKKCDCCEAVLLYFKYNIISMKPPYLQAASNNPIPPDIEINTYFPYNVVCANLSSNISYNLKSCHYKNVKFFNSPNYGFSTQLLSPWAATQPPFQQPYLPC